MFYIFNLTHDKLHTFKSNKNLLVGVDISTNRENSLFSKFCGKPTDWEIALERNSGVQNMAYGHQSTFLSVVLFSSFRTFPALNYGSISVLSSFYVITYVPFVMTYLTCTADLFVATSFYYLRQRFYAGKLC